MFGKRVFIETKTSQRRARQRGLGNFPDKKPSCVAPRLERPIFEHPRPENQHVNLDNEHA